VFSGPLDGVLGADSLSSFDVDLDLPGQRMVLYEKQTCQGAVPAWPERYATISAGRSVGDHLFFPVQLDGRRTDAFVDTGSQFTVLSTRAALAMGMTPGVLQHDRIATVLGAAAERLTARVHRFSRLEVGTEVLRNPEIIVTDVSERCRPGSRDRFPESETDLVLLRFTPSLHHAPRLGCSRQLEPCPDRR